MGGMGWEGRGGELPAEGQLVFTFHPCGAWPARVRTSTETRAVWVQLHGARLPLFCRVIHGRGRAIRFPG